MQACALKSASVSFSFSATKCCFILRPAAMVRGAQSRFRLFGRRLGGKEVSQPTRDDRMSSFQIVFFFGQQKEIDVMKNSALLMCVCVFVATAAANVCAGEWKMGVNAGYTIGGDIEESSFAPGAQVQYSFADATNRSPFFFELAGTKFSDSYSRSEKGLSMDMDLDVTALSLVTGMTVLQKDKTGLYVLGGAGYYTADADVTVDMSGILPQWPGISGFADVDIDVENSIGWILGAGVEYTIAKQVAAFVDYRYAILTLDVTGKITTAVSVLGRTMTETGEYSQTDGDYNHGIARIGVNFVF